MISRRISLISMWLACLPLGGICQREHLSLDGEWRFAVDSLHQGIAREWFRTGLPAGLSRPVTVPHTWNMERGLEDYAGLGWYEREIEIPDSWKGKAVELTFDAVYHDATVWLNGAMVGEHIGAGYTPFTLDLSRFLVTGRKNRIVVMSENGPSRNSIPFMEYFDWPDDGGIVRSVGLTMISPPVFSAVRVFAVPAEYGTRVSRGTVNFSFILRLPESVSGTLQCSVLIREERQGGRTVYRKLLSLPVSADRISFSAGVDSIRSWSFDTPSLYRLDLTLRQGGRVTDRESVVFGFREIHTEGASIVLNGEKVRLMGVEWMPASNITRGFAEHPEDLSAMLAKLRGVNAIFTRFHWQQDDAVFDWCDRHGVLVQEEVPLWGGDTPLNDTTLALARRHLGEMIAAHYNHPCIVMWGVGNELSSADPGIVAGVRMLYQHARSLDHTRLVNYVSNRIAYDPRSDAGGVGDVLMFNEYQDTWALGDPAGIGSLLDTIHAIYPEKPLVISEYGLCEPANQGGDERRVRDMIYQTSVFESKPFIAGAIYFCLNDYRTHAGETGTGVLRRRICGVYDIHGNERPSAEVLRAISSPLELFNVPWSTGHQFELVVIGSTGLPSYPCRGYTLLLGPPGVSLQNAWKILSLPDVLPGQIEHVPVDGYPFAEITAAILRPTGERVHERTFTVPR